MSPTTSVRLDEVTVYVHVRRDPQDGHHLIHPCRWQWAVTSTPERDYRASTRSGYAGWRRTALWTAKRAARGYARSLAGRDGDDYERFTYTAVWTVDNEGARK